MTDQELIFTFMNTLRIEIIREQEKLKLRATGQSAKSLRVEATNTVGKLLGDEAIIFQETGRRSGRMPPIEKIKMWVAVGKYGITATSDKDRTSIAWAIAKKIANKGTLISTFPNGSGLLSNVITAQRIGAFAKTFAEVKAAEIHGQILEVFDR